MLWLLDAFFFNFLAWNMRLFLRLVHRIFNAHLWILSLTFKLIPLFILAALVCIFWWPNITFNFFAIIRVIFINNDIILNWSIFLYDIFKILLSFDVVLNNLRFLGFVKRRLDLIIWNSRVSNRVFFTLICRKLILYDLTLI